MSTIGATTANNAYANAQVTLNMLKNEDGTAKTNDKTTEKEKNYTNGASEYVPDLSEALAMTLEGLGLGPNDRVTFNTILQYRTELSTNFESSVAAGLEKLGIEDPDFKLVTNKDGSVDVISDHADKEKIEKYFKEHPDQVDAFKQIQALTNLEEARKEGNFDIKASRSRTQLESMTTWFANSGKEVNSIMNFNSGGGSSFIPGLNITV